MLSGIRWRSSLRTKIITWSFVPTAIILVAVALVTFYAYQQVTQVLVIERDRELIRLSASRLAVELTEYAEILASEARTQDISRYNPSVQRAALRQARNRLVVFDGGVIILDPFGTLVAAEPERADDLGQDWSNRPYFRHMLRTPKPFFSDIVADGPQGAEVIVVAVPIIGDQGEFLGTIAGMFRMGTTAVSAFYGDILRLRLGESGSTYLVDGDGQVIYHSDTDSMGEDFSMQPVVQQVLNGEVGAIRTKDFEGRNIVAGYAPVPGTTWGLVTEENWATLTSKSRGYQQFLLLLLVLGVVVPALVVAVGVRRITKPITELIRAAQEVAGGNFGETISAPTGDELEDLAEQFNLMSAQLQESYAHLEQRVSDRTKELATLNAIAAVGSRSLNLDEILHNALAKTLEATGLEAGGIYLLQAETGMLTVAAHHGFRQEFVAEIDELKVGEGFSGWVAQSGKPLIVNDVSTDSRLTRMMAKEEGFHSIASVPLVSRGTVLGTLFVTTRDYRTFSPQVVELLVSIGRQIGVAVENAQLFARAEQRMQELEALYHADEELYRHLHLQDLLQALVDVAVDILEADKSTLMVWDARQEMLVVGASRGFSAETLNHMRFAPGEGIINRVVLSGEPEIVEDTDTASGVAKHITQPEGIRSLMHVPIKIGGQTFGVFNVSYVRPHAFGTEEQRLFSALAQRAALTIENAQLYEQAQQAATLDERQRLARELHDAVTQTLFSSSLIAEVLPRLWERNPDEGKRRLEELRQLTRGALAEMRTLLLELRPSALVDAELGDLLRQLAESVTGRARVPVTIEVEGEFNLPPEVKVALYRIAQEALNNIAKHAGANQAVVRLYKQHEGILELCVSDDGRGFDSDSVMPDHLGLGIMRERAEDIGATLTIDSHSDRGTRVMVTWTGESI